MQQKLSKELISNLSNKEQKIYVDIWCTLNQVLLTELVEKKILEIPKLGILKILRFKKRIRVKENGKLNVSVDWIKTKQGWKNGTLNKDKFIYHTRNWGIKISWSKERIKNIKAYSFKGSRTNGGSCNTGMWNQLWAYLAEEETNYLKIPMQTYEL